MSRCSTGGELERRRGKAKLGPMALCTIPRRRRGVAGREYQDREGSAKKGASGISSDLSKG